MSTGGGETSFQIEMSIKNSENGDHIAFKVDGERFNTSSRTLKFRANAKYKFAITIKPPKEFYHLHIAGSDLSLYALKPTSGEFTAEWNTTGIEPTHKSCREDIHLTLQGPCGTLKKTLQAKFYPNEDSHADWGTKLEQIVWRCAVDGHGNVAVVDEVFK